VEALTFGAMNMPNAAKNQDWKAALHEPATCTVSDEKVQGLLENVFGLQIPKTPLFDSEEEQKFAGMLENIFGLRLPSEMVPSAYTIFIKEYGQS
jgi:hypothetical protein